MDLPTQPQILVTNSSSIAGYSYDSSGYVLTVFYKGKSGSIYQYSNVTPGQVSQMFDQAQSVGKALKENLKGLQYKKLK